MQLKIQVSGRVTCSDQLIIPLPNLFPPNCNAVICRAVTPSAENLNSKRFANRSHTHVCVYVQTRQLTGAGLVIHTLQEPVETETVFKELM